ncbi:flagellar biosynthesis protein FlhB [Peredibacter starrii]|uniref:Flagellar biosynthetic protein FlhB n=1 Tax=Peredibacter starrii TaxID=28202 RepID=A0AAX4HNI4_9BACT|nr:flagellar biosynthesis protein FlhB [Peredibacter starrii]WPU64698.1 flagellar biosynthesis protein FlhB [Peredibacter starrii]
MADENDDEKTEEPSQYKIDESRKKGDVASSKELSSVLLLSGSLLTLIICGVFIYEQFTEYIDWMYRLDFKMIYTKEKFADVIAQTMWTLVKCLAPSFGASVCLGVLSQFIQIGFLYSPEILNADIERINPLKGFGRIFSKKSLVEAVKGVFKFTVVIAITYSVMKDNIGSFLGFLHSDAGQSLMFGKYLMVKLGFSILLGLGVVALADFGWEKWSYRQKMMMTKQEAKEEAKEKDGNPEVKSKIRQIQRQMAQKRMMDDVKKADVIVTNPTHISVALKYDGETMVAPAVMAKGADHLALRIREIAKENDIPIVENIMLARTLYKTVKVGHGVPRTLYKAVAEILSFVYKLKRKQKALK